MMPVRVPDIAALNAVGRVILLAEASALMEKYIGNRDQFGADVLALLDQGRLLPATDYVNAQRLRRMMQREFAAVWSQVDCLFTPTTPMAAPRIGEKTAKLGDHNEDVRLATTRLVRGINVLGLPALSMPCGPDRRGLPIGLQIVGRPFDEALVLRVAAALEDATEYHVAKPAEGRERSRPKNQSEIRVTGWGVLRPNGADSSTHRRLCRGNVPNPSRFQAITIWTTEWTLRALIS